MAFQLPLEGRTQTLYGVHKQNKTIQNNKCPHVHLYMNIHNCSSYYFKIWKQLIFLNTIQTIYTFINIATPKCLVTKNKLIRPTRKWINLKNIKYNKGSQMSESTNLSWFNYIESNFISDGISPVVADSAGRTGQKETLENTLKQWKYFLSWLQFVEIRYIHFLDICI